MRDIELGARDRYLVFGSSESTAAKVDNRDRKAGIHLPILKRAALRPNLNYRSEDEAVRT